MDGLRTRARAVSFAAFLAAGFPGSAPAQQLKANPADLTIIMSTYVDAVAELRQFLKACGPGDPAKWDEASGMLVASVKAAGLDETAAAELSRILSHNTGAATTYDCNSDIARYRLEFTHPADWVEYHTKTLTELGIQPVMPVAEDDPKLVAARAAIAGHMNDQSAMFACMSLIEPQWFSFAFVEWNLALDKAAAAIRDAGYAEAAAEELVGPARSAKLIAPVGDRQAAIAACIADTEWMTRYTTFNWFLVIDDVKKAVEVN